MFHTNCEGLGVSNLYFICKVGMLTAVKQNSCETEYDFLVRGFQCSTGFSIDLVFFALSYREF